MCGERVRVYVGFLLGGIYSRPAPGKGEHFVDSLGSPYQREKLWSSLTLHGIQELLINVSRVFLQDDKNGAMHVYVKSRKVCWRHIT